MTLPSIAAATPLRGSICPALVMALLWGPLPALAQQQPKSPWAQTAPAKPAEPSQPSPPTPQQVQPAPQRPTTTPPPSQSSPRWDSLPRMGLERQFAGPLQDTLIQRWRDPGDGAICYIYLPITAPHSQPTESGYVQYGANTIGSISCFAGTSSNQRR